MLAAALHAFRFYNYKYGDVDNIDRLHYWITTNSLIGISMLVSYKQFGGKPIECLVPKMFSAGWEQAPMSLLATVVGAHKYLNPSRDDDVADRLNYFITANLLITLAIVVSFKQFGGSPIECMVPDMFSKSWEQYAENYCWAQDTYYLPFDESVPVETADREQRRISYYQWVPFFLLVEALCFRLPSVMWKYLASHSGIRVHDVIKIALDDRNIQQEVKAQNIKALTIHLQNALCFHRCLRRRRITPHRILRFLNLPYSAVYICTVYLLVKSIYLVNICAQLWFMNRFLQTDRYKWYGFGALTDVLNGTTWEQSGVFPRVTLCDFQVRVMGNVQRYSVQCVLVINIFNEKIFIFLWFWYILLFFMTAFSFTYWLYVILTPWSSRNFVSRHLELSEMPFDADVSKKQIERFVSSYLKPDGAFVLRLVTLRSNIIFGTDLLVSLWCSFYGIEQQVNDNVAPAKETLYQSPIEHLLRCRLKSLTNGSKVEIQGQTAAEKLLPILQEAKRKDEQNCATDETKTTEQSDEANGQRKPSMLTKMEQYIQNKTNK